MAQSVEHIIGNDEVTSSILVSSSRSTCFAQVLFLPGGPPFPAAPDFA